MKLRQKLLAGAALLALGTLVPINTANASPLAGCSPITPQWMNFANNTPVHSSYSGSSDVIGYISTPKIIEASCISTAGNQWWKFDMGARYAYVYDGYRIPL
ncbi:hypothetical protein Skr01_34910 [Sphaerisporangium krabiense]|uniref:Ricin B lectin domain-containing protein n=1 Tax=Sphaerisporangium krabiense TaxID=763782 RepID=A0A7W9DPZ5_9ACTN|nr:hypothetical protein [Sphaerisporangium krabiense]MBB5626484.1 hypothetical protein [Sphaerisporangium krabiense]GII63406.1 hypothetical protein Skr01_34910 [Sphaerisporangium krabiense]